MTRARNARTLTPAHLKASINSESQFSFLRDMVAAVPDIQTSLDDEPLVAYEATSSVPTGQGKPAATRLRPVRAVPSARSGGRGRTRKSGRETERSASTCDEDDGDELDDGEEEDGDGDEDSSCDIPAETRESDAPPVPLLPLVTTAAHVIDDDYDAV